MTEPTAPPTWAPAGDRLDGPPRVRQGLLHDAAFVLVWFAVVGVVAALVWWQVTPLAEYTRTTTGGQMGEDQLGREVAADGWYVVVAAIGGLVSGVVLVAVRRRDPLATVLLVAVGSCVAAWVMLRVGLWVGPPDPDRVLLHAAAGAKVPMQLKTHADAAVLAWPITALLGAVGVLWGVDERRRHRFDDE